MPMPTPKKSFARKSPEPCGCAHRAQKAQIESTSWLTFLAMTIHHIPEGTVFFIVATTDLKAAVIIGLVLLVHVFPEGLAIGATTYGAYPEQEWRGPVYGAVAFQEQLRALVFSVVSKELQQGCCLQ